jgi:CMP-N-acetylneuraminic acid synthetase
MVEKQKEGGVKVCKELPLSVTRRQEAPEVYDMNASMYVYSKDFLLDPNNKTPYAKKALIYEMPEISRIDIDSELDFKFIEFLIQKGYLKF